MANPFEYENTKAIPKLYHHADLDKEDEVFKDALIKFVQKIGCSNFSDASQYVESEELKKEYEEKSKNMKDEDEDPVELDVAEASKCDDSAMSPMSPRNPMSPSQSFSNYFEDIFTEDDSLLEKTSPPSDSCEEFSKAVTEVLTGLDPTGEVNVFVPDPLPKTETETETDERTDKSPLKGFDLDGFAEVEAIVQRMLAKVDTTLNMDMLVEQLDQYEVVLELDAEREICDVVSNKMAEVQAQIDSLSSVLKKLSPLADTLSQAWEYIQDVGILYAQASNREKRLAQVKLVAKDLWLQFVETSRVRKSYDMRFRELKGQWETLSRLITADQNRFQYSKIVHRGPLPYESPEKPQQPKPEAKPAEETETKMGFESIFEIKKNEPLEMDKFSHLDDMPDVSKVAEPSGTKDKRIVDWDLDF